jgi:hypothetical protein
MLSELVCFWQFTDEVVASNLNNEDVVNLNPSFIER